VVILIQKKLKKLKEGQKSDYGTGIPECGTDALRFALCAYTSQGRDINLDVKRVAAYRNFCNKLWNVIKFAMMNLGADFTPSDEEPVLGITAIERWVLSRLSFAEKQANAGFQTYEFSQTTTALHSFWLYELCDVYLEAMKPIMQTGTDEQKKSAKETLFTCIDHGLRLLHPFMPFVTEELWQRLPHRKSQPWESICISRYPQSNEKRFNPQLEAEMKFVQDIIHELRVLRTSFGLTKEKPKIFVNLHTEDVATSLRNNHKDTIAFLSQSAEALILYNEKTVPAGCAVQIVNETCQVYMQIKDLVNIQAEIEKLEKKKEKLQADFDKILKLTHGQHYGKVPENVKKENSDKMASIEQEIGVTNKAIENFKKFVM